MRYLWLVLALAIFGTGFALLGATAAVYRGHNEYVGLIAGGAVGLFFGLIFGGDFPKKWADALFGPESKEDRD